jgi:hypothetical protein
MMRPWLSRAVADFENKIERRGLLSAGSQIFVLVWESP